MSRSHKANRLRPLIWVDRGHFPVPGMRKLAIKQILQVPSADLEIQHAIDRAADGADRVASRVDGDSTSDCGMVVAGAMVDDSKVLGREKEIGLG